MRIFFFLLCLSCFLFSKEGYWSYEKDFSLKKDEFVLFRVEERKNLLFRWTLFHNKGLVYLAKYDDFPYQGILYKKFKLDSFKITTGRNINTNIEDPYCMITFKDFDTKKEISKFTIYCFDPKGVSPIRLITEK